MVFAGLDGFGWGVTQGTVFLLRDAERSGSSEVLNSRDEPDGVKVFRAPTRVKGSELMLGFDPFSMTLYESEVRAAQP